MKFARLIRDASHGGLTAASRIAHGILTWLCWVHANHEWVEWVNFN